MVKLLFLFSFPRLSFNPKLALINLEWKYESANFFYRISVHHFTTWYFDRAICIGGCIVAPRCINYQERFDSRTNKNDDFFVIYNSLWSAFELLTLKIRALSPFHAPLNIYIHIHNHHAYCKREGELREETNMCNISKQD